jgi:hypothetical protein
VSLGEVVLFAQTGVGLLQALQQPPGVGRGSQQVGGLLQGVVVGAGQRHGVAPAPGFEPGPPDYKTPRRVYQGPSRSTADNGKGALTCGNSPQRSKAVYRGPPQTAVPKSTVAPWAPAENSRMPTSAPGATPPCHHCDRPGLRRPT